MKRTALHPQSLAVGLAPLPPKRELRRLLVAIVLCSLVVPGMSWGQADPEACDKAMLPASVASKFKALRSKVTVPSFQCNGASGTALSSVLVNDLMTSPGHCEHSEELNTRCVKNAWLGKLVDNEYVTIVYSCRPTSQSMGGSLLDVQYNDLAVIQYGKQTGATCFYQALPGSNEYQTYNATITAPSKSPDFFDAPVYYCAKCHSNGPFIRTPHYDYSLTKNATGGLVEKLYNVLPSVYSINKYKPVNAGSFEVVNVGRMESGRRNGCTNCHNIGAFGAAGGDRTGFSLGFSNFMASGERKDILGGGYSSPTTASLPGDPEPVSAGYDDYMASKVGGLANAKKYVEALQECFTTTPIPKGCTFTDPVTGKPHVWK